ncbi:hypothetical protein COEREDRAFT_5790 [Coemansia reversa NRRL 1564]|uniref:Uncharacterized protein n=1 Tax=Coemansia reversa (strain ATCC 12441 / NRRL 1564) TaxID=763665 RepID=A0A2G5BJT4_COERN|nr:hypothetical protein COEREDRAFT_5790 [Coemansia reversa NRRL 1564]|eukprot:PIA19275.1 hypothetical protein COEREDRAFT_5790 [Coemansia reversa NRRL 1564]
MGDETAEHTDGHETPLPLSESFRDTAFIKFVNEADSRNKSNSPAQRVNTTSTVSITNKHGHGNHQNSNNSAANPHRQQHNKHATDSPLQTQKDGMSGSHRGHPSNSTDDDGEWDELDDIELDSQTMRQLVETEEHFYATQQFLLSTDMPFSQEFVDPPVDAKQRTATRCASAGGGFHDTRGPQTVPSPAAQSVPVTPNSAGPIYISDSDSPARFSGSETGHVHGMAAGSSHGASVPSQPHPQQLLPYQQHQQQRRGLDRASSAHLPLNDSARRRTNLFPRLAPHIPTKSSNAGFPQHRRPPPLASGSAAPAQHSTHLRSRQQLQTGNGMADQQFDLNTSILDSSSSSNHRVITTRNSGTPQAQALQQRADSSSAMDEMRRLREENARMRAEQDLLRAQLYTKEGEVKIVRDNLAKTEIENTHLQERLANQISASSAAQEHAEKSLSSEIERLKTQLLFQQHEAQAATASQIPTRMATPRSVRAIPLLSSGRKDAYPSFEEFMATPKQSTCTSSASSASKTLQSSTPQRRQKKISKSSASISASTKSLPTGTPLQPQKRQPGDLASASSIGKDNSSDLQEAESVAALLETLTRISQHPADAGFGGLMLLAVQLAKAVQAPESENIDAFHLQACSMLDHLSRPPGHGQLESVVELLLQAVELPAICSSWLLDISESEVNCSAQQEKRNVAKGHYRLGQLCVLLGKALQVDVAASAKLRRRSRESAAYGRTISAQVRLVVRLIGLQPAAALSSDVWAQFSVQSLAVHISPGLHLTGLSAMLELVAVLIQASTQAWQRLRDHPQCFEQLLVAALKRLRLAFAKNESHMLDAHRKLLVLIASAIVIHEEDSKLLINAARQLTVALVHWFLDEHRILVDSRSMPPHDEHRRVTVFCEHIKCLNVILSEVDDVVALLGGDDSPLLFAFVATSTRMSYGERPFAGIPALRELAADLLAYVVTEDQALSIQQLIDF